MEYLLKNGSYGKKKAGAEICLKSRQVSAWQTERAELSLYSLDHPAVIPLVPHTRIESQSVITGSGCAAGVCFPNLGYGNDLIGPGPQLGDPGNGIARFQRVQVLEVVPCAPVVCRKAAVSIPETCIFEMPHAFAERGAVRSLIHLGG